MPTLKYCSTPLCEAHSNDNTATRRAALSGQHCLLCSAAGAGEWPAALSAATWHPFIVDRMVQRHAGLTTAAVRAPRQARSAGKQP